jgi:U3 small nucleolar RNA-associated protein 18
LLCCVLQDDSFRQVVVSGRRPFFYWADIETGAVGKVPRIMGREEKSLERFAASPDGRWLAFTGTDGTIILVSAKTKQWVGNFKMNGTARAVTFSADGTQLYGSGGDALVYRWDLRSQKCLGRFSNEGGTVTSSLAAAGHGAMGYTAVGSESGVVNVYDNGHVATLKHARDAGNLRPLKALMNLTTTIDSLGFNHDHQVLALASRWSRDSLKLVSRLGPVGESGG